VRDGRSHHHDAEADRRRRREDRIAVDRPPGIYQIADDNPATAAVWLPELARILGAKPPLHIPAWLAKAAVGDVGVSAFTKIRGADNSKARDAFSWQPGYASWREGFRHGL
jgi:nucleoside-diphosphate-sugar epimerase